MSKQEIEFRDPVVKRVVNKFVSRSDVGFAKYGVTLDKDPSEMFQWLNHLQEELMDAVLYLQKAKIKTKYEGETFVLLNGFHFENEVYERQSNGKGEYKNRGCKRILPIKYTPDFIGDDFIIETKGRANESFPMRWKMFKLLVSNQFPGHTLYKPQNQKECDETVRLILEKQNK